MANREGPEKCTMAPLTDEHKTMSISQGLQVANQAHYNYLTAKGDVGVSGGGRWYFEVTLHSNQNILIGFVNRHCGFSNNGQHIGSDSNSWAYDGYQGQKICSGKTEKYGSSYWKNGDVIGVLLDLDQHKLSFLKNGADMGVCFSDMPKDQPLFPACSVRRYQSVTFNFGDSKFRFPQPQAFSYILVISPKQKKSIEKLFEHYQKIGAELSASQDGRDDADDVICADGVFQFATDAGAKDDSDPLLLVIAFKLHGERPWEFSRDEWVRGFSLNGLYDISSIKKTAAQWKKDIFGNPELFKVFYNWTFDYLREDRKILSMEEANTLWSMLDLNDRWKMWSQWIEFLTNKKKRQYVSRDEWGVLLTFAMEHPKDLAAYDPDGPWPTLLDDFVAFTRGELDED